ncbi:unnamed protein product, partial [Mesorhabditis belari]|uniref:Glutamate receptor 1 n=1 Tax=Mesorhabditis belari TaxID=2138241 RepID=A0AAF3E916_9BILA
MLRLAEYTFNGRFDAEFDVLLGTRELPPFEKRSLDWNLNHIICDELKVGFMIMLAGSSTNSFSTFRAIANAMQVPFIDWEVSNRRSIELQSPMTFSVRPPVDELLVDYMIHKGWHQFVYIHDGANAARTLFSLFSYAQKIRPEWSFEVDNYEAPTDEEFFREFLNKFHRKNIMEEQRRRNISLHSIDELQTSDDPINVVVDLEGGYRMRAFLRALEETVLVKREYHYVFANLEMEDSDLFGFHYSLINITGFQIFDRNSKDFIKERKSFEDHYKEKMPTAEWLTHPSELRASSAFAHDALLVGGTAAAIVEKERGANIFKHSFSQHQLFNRGLPGIYCRPHEDILHQARRFESFEHGALLAEAIKKVDLDERNGTLTGRIQFDPQTGLRKNFSATVIEIRPGINSLTSIRERYQWAHGKGFLFGKTSVSEHRQDRTPMKKGILADKPWKLRFNIVTLLVDPFVMVRRQNPGDPVLKGNDRFEGYCIDLLELLAKNITGFEYDIFISEGNKYGKKQLDGSWDGAIGYLLNETADVAVAPLTINQERERVVDFSKPFMTTGISIMINKPEKQEYNILSFMQPLGTTIWILTACSYIGVSLTIFVVSSFSPYEQRIQFNRGEFSVTNEFSIYNSLWFTLAAFMQQGTDILPRALSGRIASSCWWFYTLIIVSSYTANLAAFLTLEKMTPPIESVEDLADQETILYGIVKGGSTQAFFEDSTVPLFKKMWNFMQNAHAKQLKTAENGTTDSIFVNTYARGIEKVRKSKGKYAFLLEETTNNYENTRKPCNTMKVGINLNTLGYGIATKIGNPLRESINLAILYLQERGELKRLEYKWWYDRAQCEIGGTENANSSSLNLSKVAGIFYILSAGMALALITALVEIIGRQHKEKTKKRKVNRLNPHSHRDEHRQRSRSEEPRSSQGTLF